MKFKDLNLLAVGNTIQMVGAVYAGDGMTFVCLFPGDKIEGSIDQLEMDLPEWEGFLRQTDLMETEILAKDPGGTIIKALVRKSQRAVDQTVNWAVFRRDGYCCRYCGNDNVPLTVDHLVLWEEGGPSTVANLVSCCKKCNKTRGNLQYADWLGHPFYLAVSKALTAGQRQANAALVATLPTIPRIVHKRSR
jgi:hypothetical protein